MNKIKKAKKVKSLREALKGLLLNNLINYPKIQIANNKKVKALYKDRTPL